MSFKFDFSDDDEEEEVDYRHLADSKRFKIPAAPQAVKPKRECLPFSEITVADVALTWREKNELFSIEQTSERATGHPSVSYIQVHEPAEKLAKTLKDAKLRTSDLIAGKYEGGMTLWECSVDLMAHMSGERVRGKRVVELGCGFGLPGLLAHQLGARSVHFQDYNASVINSVTAPSCVLQSYGGDGSDFHAFMTSYENSGGFRFFAGDWGQLADNVSPRTYDVILTSETIYDEANYEKLHDVLKLMLEPHSGVVLVAAKSFYFGVGGGVDSWMNYVRNRGYFLVENVKEIDEGLTRNILEMTVKEGALDNKWIK